VIGRRYGDPLCHTLPNRPLREAAGRSLIQVRPAERLPTGTVGPEGTGCFAIIPSYCGGSVEGRRRFFRRITDDEAEVADALIQVPGIAEHDFAEAKNQKK